MKRAPCLRSILLVSLCVSLLAGCGKGAEEESGPIKIGLEAPLSGDYAYEGEGFERSVILLVDQVNAQGGILGRPVELIVVDDGGDPDQAAAAAQRLVDEGVVAVIGGYDSSSTEKSSEVLDEHGILQITPSSTATRLTERGFERFFRVCPLDDRQGLLAAKFMAEVLGAKDVAIIHDGSTYSKGLADWTKLYAEERGLNVVYFAAVDPEAVDLSVTLINVATHEPDATYFTGYHVQAAHLLAKSQELEVGTQWILGDACNNPDLIEIAGADAVEGVFVTTAPLVQDLPYPETRQFIADFAGAYGEEPNSIWWAMAADAFNVIRHAIEETGSTDPARLAQFLHTEFEGLAGITGSIGGFDGRGDRLGSIHKAYVIHEGSFQFHEKQPTP